MFVISLSLDYGVLVVQAHVPGMACVSRMPTYFTSVPKTNSLLPCVQDYAHEGAWDISKVPDGNEVIRVR